MEAVGEDDGLRWGAGSGGESETCVAIGAESVRIAGFAERVCLGADVVGEVVAVRALEALGAL